MRSPQPGPSSHAADSDLAGRQGNRKLRYRGVAKNNAWLHHRTAALNLRRLLNLGFDLEQGAWTLA